MNILAILVAALVPMIVGFIWYNPKVLGNAWIKASGLDEEKMKSANMVLIFCLTFVFSLMMAFFMQAIVIHQFHIASVFFDYREQIKDATTPEGALYKQVMDLVSSGHRTFGHGMFHGILGSLFLVLPIVAINAMFERRGFKYIAINLGFWMI